MSSSARTSARRSLIVNADGFGFAPGVNRGIEEAVEHGVVHSTSCVVNFPAIEELPVFAARWPHVSAGIHFNLSVGRPLSDPSRVRTLVDSDGMFLGDRLPRRLLSGAVDREDIRRELRAQIDRMVGLGVPPSHWDGHQNKHLYFSFFEEALVVARACGVRRMRTPRRYVVPAHQDAASRPVALARYYTRHPRRVATHAFGRALAVLARRRGMRMADRLISPVHEGATGKWLLHTWLRIVEQLPSRVSEIYCHPGYVDDTLRAHARYVEERELEIQVLTSPELNEKIGCEHVQLVSFRDL
jgi:chitin disaccharide deacetylase